jgi:GT2 family glycosyltransferase
MASLSAVIPCLNGLAILRRNLPAILDELRGCEVVVSDDGSIDGTLQEGPQLFPAVRFLSREGRPRGFCHAVNDGFRASVGESVLLLNNDVVPSPGAFAGMLEKLEGSPPEVWAVVPEVLREGLGDEGSMRFRFRRGLAFVSQAGPGTVYPSGACALFRRTAWEELGGLDSSFAPIYWEDADIGARAAARGWRVARAEGSRVLHEHAATTGHSLEAERLRERNRFIFMKIHYSGFHFAIRTASWMPAHLLLAALRGRFEFHLGLFDYLRWEARRAREGR